MGDKSGIRWTDATWNPITGCSRVSSGCDNCYAMSMAHRQQAMGHTQAYNGTTRKGKKGVDWTGHINLLPERLDQPIRWKRPRRIFVNSMSDLFHPSVPFSFVDKVWAAMALAPQHQFQILTKRPERMAEHLEELEEAGVTDSLDTIAQSLFGQGIQALPWPLPNVWLGTSVENQETADKRIIHLLECEAHVRWLSLEPLLGPVDLQLSDRWLPGDTGIDWVVLGGESGVRARPMNPDWVRAVRDECTRMGVPFHFKQWGTWMPYEEDAQPPFFSSQHGDMIDGHGLPDLTDHEVHDGWLWPDPDCGTIYRKVGKHKAGHRIDGWGWDQYPEELSHG